MQGLDVRRQLAHWGGVGIGLAMMAPAALALHDLPSARLMPDEQLSVFTELGSQSARGGVAGSVVGRLGLVGWVREDVDQFTSTLGLDARLLLVEERGLWPALAIGTEALGGREVDGRDYLAVSRRVGPLDVDAGWSMGRYEGAFAKVAGLFGNQQRYRFVLGLQQQAAGSPISYSSLSRRWSDRWTTGLGWSSADGVRLEVSYQYHRSSAAARPAGTPPPPPPRGPNPAALSTDQMLVIDDQAGLVWADLGELPIGSRTLGLWASKADLLLSDSRYMTIIPVSQGIDGQALRVDRQKLRLVSYNLASAEEVVADIRPVPPPPQPRPERGWHLDMAVRLDVDTPAYGDGLGVVQSNAFELQQPIGWGLAMQTGIEVTSLSSLQRYESDDPIRSDRQRLADNQRARLRQWGLAGSDTGADWLAAGQLGWLDAQFAGVDGQWLHHNTANRLSLGAETSLVWRREPASVLAVTQGRPHFTLLGVANYAWPEVGSDVTVRAGRFLGGDWGGEVQMAHRWPNGLVSQIGLALSSGLGADEPAGGVLRMALSLPSVIRFGEQALSGRYEVRAGDLFGDRAQRLERRLDVVGVHRATSVTTALADWPEFSQEVYLPTQANQQNWQQAVGAAVALAGDGG